ncbi:MAG: hypothetical protein GY857_18715, partial [Desulfobacula sp.]|nr:hypothetical protein [Desulfobacula sp.]
EKPIDHKKLESIILTRLSTNSLGTSYLAKQIAKEFNFSKKYIYDMILKIQKGGTPL